MIGQLLAKVIGTQNEREIKRLRPAVAEIGALEPQIQALTDEQLRAKSDEFRKRVADGESLDDLLVEAFAVVREAGRRVLNMRHFDVQLMGGMVLHNGRIAEMKTGEGKTLVATLPAYLNALEGKGVHVVTTNDYLARRDSEWMGKIYRFLGMTVGVIQHELNDAERQKAYAADITYGTNNEFGFDYLRDNMKFELDRQVQRGHHFAIVDEVDSILIDEARTPLIISGAAEESAKWYRTFARIAPRLRRDDHYEVDDAKRTVAITEQGVARVEELLGIENLYDQVHTPLVHYMEAALKGKELYKRDRDYMVEGGEVLIVDEFTGRTLPGRRWSDGLHQAVEAKEGVKIERENQTLATITLQNYFRLYEKLSGMTGTAETEAAEFHATYKLDVIVIPTNQPMVRRDNSDVIYRTLPEKWDAVVEEIQELHEKGQPVLVGTVSVENSELISRRLHKVGIPHKDERGLLEFDDQRRDEVPNYHYVLNAKHHEREAEIVAQAGRKGAITIATNMAGRGTDILLGGNPEFMAREHLKIEEIDPDEATEEQFEEALEYIKPFVEREHKEVVSLGGLHILGTERHESRRIDNQLRGRAGRQGDPGSSRFFLSLEDDLMRIFAGDKVKALMQRLGMEKGVAIESKMVSRRIEAAQKSVEARNFESRKHLLQYDDVMNRQRETIYGLRRQLMEEPDQRDYILGVAEDLLSDLVKQYLPAEASPDDWDVENLKIQLQATYAFDADAEGIDFDNWTPAQIDEAVWEKAKASYESKEA